MDHCRSPEEFHFQINLEQSGISPKASISKVGTLSKGSWRDLPRICTYVALGRKFR